MDYSQLVDLIIAYFYIYMKIQYDKKDESYFYSNENNTIVKPKNLKFLFKEFEKPNFYKKIDYQDLYNTIITTRFNDKFKKLFCKYIKNTLYFNNDIAKNLLDNPNEISNNIENIIKGLYNYYKYDIIDVKGNNFCN